MEDPKLLVYIVFSLWIKSCKLMQNKHPVFFLNISRFSRLRTMYVQNTGCWLQRSSSPASSVKNSDPLKVNIFSHVSFLSIRAHKRCNFSPSLTGFRRHLFAFYSTTLLWITIIAVLEQFTLSRISYPSSSNRVYGVECFPVLHVLVNECFKRACWERLLHCILTTYLLSYSVWIKTYHLGLTV